MTSKKREPEPERDWVYQSQSTGNRGYLVMEDGKQKVRLDRPDEEIIVPFDGTWSRLKEHRPLSRYHLTHVAFVADRALLKALGKHAEARIEWESLTPEERRDWMELGPEDDGVRERLYNKVLEALEELGG